jgi:hypothetical protein
MLITSPCDSVLVSECYVSKMGLNRRSNAHTAGGAGSHPPPNRVIWKRTVNSILAMGHQAALAHCTKFLIFHMAVVHQIHIAHYYYFDWGRRL